MSLAQKPPPSLENVANLSQYILQLIETKCQALKDELEANRKENKDAINKLQSSIKTLESETKSLKMSIKSLELEHKSLKITIKSLEKELKKQGTRNQQLDDEKSELKIRVVELEGKVQANKKIIDEHEIVLRSRNLSTRKMFSSEGCSMGR